MARKKVKLAWIANDAVRKTTFKKRKQGLLKKVGELSVLCGVTACAVLYVRHETNPEAWPSVSEARELFMEYKSMPGIEQCKKMMNQEGFVRHQVMKLEEQRCKQDRENHELEMMVQVNEGLVGKSLNDVAIAAVTRLAWTAEMKLKAMRERVELLKEQMASNSIEGSMENIAMDGATEALRRQNWMMEMVSPSEHAVFSEEQTMQPYVDNFSLWLEDFFPLD